MGDSVDSRCIQAVTKILPLRRCQTKFGLLSKDYVRSIQGGL